nr:MAG TPA: hypothetical protein [Caudoviricetes sp.]
MAPSRAIMIRANRPFLSPSQVKRSSDSMMSILFDESSHIFFAAITSACDAVDSIRPAAAARTTLRSFIGSLLTIQQHIRS